MKRIMFVFIMGLFLLTGCDLKIVDVGAPAINCVFDSSCTVTVTDTTDVIPIPTGGSNFLQSRTVRGKPGSPADGLYGYEYRVNLKNAMGITYIPCISSLKLSFGPMISTLDYDGDGMSDQVYVVTSGGLGSIGLSSADMVGNEITFTFSEPVCAGGSPGTGQSTYFFGLISTQPPKPVTAQVTETIGSVYNVQARAPHVGGTP